MGNAISGLPPLSVASVIIGIISFVFTLLTAIRVFWQNLRTLGSANKEVRTVLPNLKQALYEERHLLRMTRRKCRGLYEEGAFRILEVGIREMVSEFKKLEEPFVEFPEDGGRRREKGRGDRRNGGSAGMRAEREKAKDFAMEMGKAGRAHRESLRSRGERRRSRDARSEEDEDDRFANGRANGTVVDEDEYYNVEFGAVTLWQRWQWVRKRSQIMDLASRLSRVQGRRMARQTTETCIDTKYIARVIAELQDRVEGLEGRFGRGGGGGRRMMD